LIVNPEPLHGSMTNDMDGGDRALRHKNAAMNKIAV